MSKHASYRLEIKEHHLDTYGHVNNATYIALFEEARWEQIHKHGYGLDVVRKELKGPVILEMKVRFASEIKNREQVEIVSDIIEYKKKIFRMTQKLINSEGEIACEAELVGGLMDLRTRKLILPTSEWLAALNLSPEEIET